MNIGDVVTVDVQVVGQWSDTGRKKTVIEESIDPLECVYLGMSQRRSAYMVRGDEYEDPRMAYSKATPVAMMQPLDPHGRYRKPFAAPARFAQEQDA